jgi:chromosome partitioning protein
MKTVAIISQKGGSGKTTIALHLAVAAERHGIVVSVLDLDPQTSATGWKDDREGENPSVISIQASRLPKAIEVARGADAGLILIDSVANAPELDIAAAEVADLILIPCRPRKHDMKSISTTARIARLTGKPAFIVLNAVPPNSPRIVEDANAALTPYGLPVAPALLHQRNPYGYALDANQTVQEYEPDGKGAQETEELFLWLRKVLDL